MKIVIAIDSFKGSLTSIDAANVTASAIKKLFGDKVTIKKFPLADGGEGTVDALTSGLGGEIINTEVIGPLGEKILSRYGLIKSKNTAVIEMADAAGLNLVPEHLRNPLKTTTYGLGELIINAVNKGCREFIIGIGGSATNDCGLGMLSALGVKFFDSDQKSVSIFGADLKNISTIDLSTINPLIKECKFKIACDVKNPLYGENGCSVIYAPQKGATPEIVIEMDRYIKHFADIVKTQLNLTGAEVEGAGAAGGLGYAFHIFLNATLEPGIDLILNAINIKDDLKNADILITGEGRLDSQTIMGKAPIGVAKLAKKINPNIKVIAVCGCANEDAEIVNDHGIDAYFTILHKAISVNEAMEISTAKKNLSQTITQIFRLLNLGDKNE